MTGAAVPSKTLSLPLVIDYSKSISELVDEREIVLALRGYSMHEPWLSTRRLHEKLIASSQTAVLALM